MDSELSPIATELEGTQISDLSDETLRACGIPADQIAKIRAMPATMLSSLLPIVFALGREKAVEIAPKLPFVAEIDEKGRRRCVMMEDGRRCCKYGDKEVPVCKKHYKDAKMLGNYFGSPMLRETYKRFHEDPNKMNCNAELSLMRTMLASLLQRINDDNLNIEIMAGVTAMCDKITVVVERLSKLEKVTPEHLAILMKQVTELAVQYIPPEKLEEFASAMEKVSIEPDAITQREPYLPGASVDVEGAKMEVSIQKRALLEVAAHMGVTTDGK